MRAVVQRVTKAAVTLQETGETVGSICLLWEARCWRFLNLHCSATAAMAGAPDSPTQPDPRWQTRSTIILWSVCGGRV